MPKIFWGINVYTRINHLRLQEALIRRHFGDRIELLVFSNHEKNGSDILHFEEDHLQIFPINRGGHTGVQDAYNSVLEYLRPEHEFVVWSHADCILTDYSLIEETIERMERTGAVFASLDGIPIRNNPRSDSFEPAPFCLHDLKIYRADFYRRVYPRDEVLGGMIEGPDGMVHPAPYGAEVALGMWVLESLREGESVHAMGKNISHFKFADGLGDCAASACMINDFEMTVHFVRLKLDDETVDWLDSQGLLTKRFDDYLEGHN